MLFSNLFLLHLNLIHSFVVGYKRRLNKELQFSTNRQLQIFDRIPTEEIVGAHSFDFIAEFFQIGFFSVSLIGTNLVC